MPFRYRILLKQVIKEAAKEVSGFPSEQDFQKNLLEVTGSVGYSEAQPPSL